MKSKTHRDVMYRFNTPKQMLALLVLPACDSVIDLSLVGRSLLSALLPMDCRWFTPIVVWAIGKRQGLDEFQTGFALGELINTGLLEAASIAGIGRAA